MMFRRICFIGCLLAPASLFCETSVAVLPVQGGTAETSEAVKQALIATGKYRVVDEALTGQTSESGISQSGLLEDRKRLLALGELYKAQKLLLGRVGRTEAGVHIDIKLVDVSSGNVELQGSADAEDEEALRPKIPQAIASMKPPVQSPKISPYAPLWRSALVPGWGQYHSGHRNRGGLLFGGHLLLGWLLYQSVQDYNSAVKEHDRATWLGVAGLATSNVYAAVGANVVAQWQAAKAEKRIDRSRIDARRYSLALAILYGYNVVDAWKLGRQGVAVGVSPSSVDISYVVRF